MIFQVFILLHNVVLKTECLSTENSKYAGVKGKAGSSLCQPRLRGCFSSLLQICGSLSSAAQSLTYSHTVFYKI